MASEWESDTSFDDNILVMALLPPICSLVDWRGNTNGASMGVTTLPNEKIQKVIQGDALGSVMELQFRVPGHFCAQNQAWVTFRAANKHMLCTGFGKSIHKRLFLSL